MSEKLDIRWKQRFENLCLAYNQFIKATTANLKSPEDQLIQMAVIKSFEMTFELSWKTMKDFLNHNGVDSKLPREVIKQSFAHNIIEDGQLWIDMLEQRNLMTHTYDEVRARKAVELISKQYKAGIEQIIAFFRVKI